MMNLEEQSFRNMVHFYRDELRRIMDGERASRLFSTVERTGLRNKGILYFDRHRHRSIRVGVTHEARTALRAMSALVLLFMLIFPFSVTWGAAPVTFDLRVINSSSVALENATASLKNSTHTIFMVKTNSTGHIAQQTVDSGNYTFSITRAGYVTYEHDYEVNEGVNWIVMLYTPEEATTMTNDLPLVFFGFMFAALGLMYYGWTQRDEENAIIGYSLSLLFWIATIGQWVFDTSTSDNLIIWWVFLAPLILCALKIVEASLGSLGRTEKTLGRY